MESPPRSQTPPRPARPLPSRPDKAKPPSLDALAAPAQVADAPVANARRRALPPLMAVRAMLPSANHEDPLGLGMARTSLAQPAAQEPVAPPKRQPPSLSGERVKKPPPALSDLKRAALESKYTAARSSAQGELQLEEVRAFLESEGIDVDDAYVQQCMEQFDEDGNGTLSLDEFHVLVLQVAPTLLDQEGRGMRWDHLRNIKVPELNIKVRALHFSLP